MPHQWSILWRVAEGLSWPWLTVGERWVTPRTGRLFITGLTNKHSCSHSHLLVLQRRILTRMSSKTTGVSRGHLEETDADTWRTCRLHTERALFVWSLITTQTAFNVWNSIFHSSMQHLLNVSKRFLGLNSKHAKSPSVGVWQSRHRRIKERGDVISGHRANDTLSLYSF